MDVVVAGGAGPEFSCQALNQAFSHLQRGARLVAMHSGLYWRTSEGLQPTPAHSSQAWNRRQRPKLTWSAS